MAGRRGAGEGAVYFIESRGLWAGAVNLGSVGGRRQRKVVKAKTKAEVLRRMRKLQGDIGQGLPIPDNSTTTGEWLSWWLSDVLPDTAGASSSASGHGRVRNHFAGTTGQAPARTF